MHFGPRPPLPQIRERGQSPKKFLLALRPQFSPKLKVGPGPLGPSPGSTTGLCLCLCMNIILKMICSFQFPIVGVGAFFFLHRNVRNACTCGNPAEVPILFLFCFAFCLFVFFNRAFLHNHSQVILVFRFPSKANKTVVMLMTFEHSRISRATTENTSMFAGYHVGVSNQSFGS